MSHQLPLPPPPPSQPLQDTMMVSAVPTLRVMRLQKPELHMAKTSSSSSSPSFVSTMNTAAAHSAAPQLMIESTPSLLQSALCLPDSLTVYVGETFTAYLGVLNTPSTTIPTSSSSLQYPTIRRLSVVAQLQTPSQRYPLPSRLDPQPQPQRVPSTTTTFDTTTPTITGNSTGVDVPPFCGVDAIVSRSMEEPGPHILRIEVGYYTPPDLLHYQTFRKFYRFNVKLPIIVTEKYTVRNNDTSCYTCIQIEYPIPEPTTTNSSNEKHQPEALVLSNVQFVTPDGLIATPVTTETKQEGTTCSETQEKTHDDTLTSTQRPRSAVELLDDTPILLPGSKISLMYHIQTNTPEATLRGIAVGDLLGHVSYQWYKAMGEHGTITTSPSFHCPAAATTNASTVTPPLSSSSSSSSIAPFVMHRSGLSVDVAATAAAMSTNMDDTLRLITVEPVDPPLQMQRHVPVTVPLLVVNHSRHPCAIQIQFNIPPTTHGNINDRNHGIVIAGATHQNIGTIPSHGGSTVTNFTFLPLQTGLLPVQHCSIMDVTSSGRTVLQPPLWMTHVTPWWWSTGTKPKWTEANVTFYKDILVQ